MRMLVALAVASALSAVAVADDGAVKMTRDELLSFLPGARVTHVSKAGSTRIWTNGADGTFVASSDNKLFGGAYGGKSASSAGTWMVNDEGKYCIHIDWKRVDEKWCAYILKASDGYYLNAVDPSHKIEFVK